MSLFTHDIRIFIVADEFAFFHWMLGELGSE